MWCLSLFFVLRTKPNPLARKDACRFAGIFFVQGVRIPRVQSTTRYCGSAEIYVEISTDLETISSLLTRTPHSPSAFVSHIISSVHSPRSARNAGHRFTKNSYQPFFPRSPYLFGARDTISTNYTCCAICTFHLLASQYSAFAECTIKVAL